MAINTDSYKKIKTTLDEKKVTLVAVSKTKPPEDILALYGLGQRDFGENYVQELVDKYETLPKDIRWHFIGHLQTNKVRYIAPFIYLIHGVDSERLLSEINKQASKVNRIIPCLLQVHISKDETKFGFDEQELDLLLIKMSRNKEHFKHVAVHGLMGMATFTEDNDLIKTEFEQLNAIFIRYASCLTPDVPPVLSMGMSADYMLAVKAGSTMVRIGSLLFGERAH